MDEEKDPKVEAPSESEQTVTNDPAPELAEETCEFCHAVKGDCAHV